MSGAVRFIRVRGRIVPIMAKGAQGIKRAAKASVHVAKKVAPYVPAAAGLGLVGGYVGATFGSVGAMIKNVRDSPKFEKEMQRNRVGTKAFVKKHERGTTAITNQRELMKDKHLTSWEKIGLSGFVDAAERGSNAAAFQIKNRNGKDRYYVIAGKKINKAVVGHELGHIRQYKSNMDMRRGAFHVIGGKQYKIEADAWDRSPVKGEKHNQPIKGLALKTYKRARDYSRVGAGLGALAFGGFAVIASIAERRR